MKSLWSIIKNVKRHGKVSQSFYKGEALEGIDAIVPRIGASVTLFGTAIVRQFEMQKIVTSASAQAIEVSRDNLKVCNCFLC